VRAHVRRSDTTTEAPVPSSCPCTRVMHPWRMTRGRSSCAQRAASAKLLVRAKRVVARGHAEAPAAGDEQASRLMPSSLPEVVRSESSPSPSAAHGAKAARAPGGAGICSPSGAPARLRVRAPARPRRCSRSRGPRPCPGRSRAGRRRHRRLARGPRPRSPPARRRATRARPRGRAACRGP
jgi:hypothetical protein